MVYWDWSDGDLGVSALAALPEFRCHPQHSQGGSRSSVMPVLGGTAYLGCTDTHVGKIPMGTKY